MENVNFSGVNASYYSTFTELLWEWIATTQKSYRVMGTGDPPWWYNERTSLALLAGAIWRAGGIALQEHDIDRIAINQTDKQRAKHGRCDLYFALDKFHYIAEAKQLWLSLGARNPEKKINDALKDAANNVKSSGDEGYERLAILFISPYSPQSVLPGDPSYKTSETQKAMDNLIHNFVSNTLPACTKKARAWIFPDDTRLLSDESSKNPRIYPGSAILIHKITSD